MDRIEGIISTDFVLHRGPIDDPMIFHGETEFIITNEHDVVVPDEQQILGAAVDWMAQQVRADAENIQVIRFSWSAMPAVDASELPPPAL